MLKWEKLLNEIEKFKFIISYLSEAKHYVADTVLKSDIETAINRLGEVIVKGDTQRKQYMRELEQLKERYADYYLAAYVAAHLPATEEALLTAIRNMPEKQVAETVAQAGGLFHGPPAKSISYLPAKVKVSPVHFRVFSVMS